MKRFLLVLLALCVLSLGSTVMAEESGEGWSYDAKKDELKYSGDAAEVFVPRLLEDNEVFSTANCLLGNTAVVNAVVAEGHQSIGYRTFDGCASLESVTLPGTVQEIYGSAFSGCKSLKEIALPASLRLIGESAFEGCSALTKLVIPAGVVMLEDYAFADCVSLSEMRFLGHAPYFGYSSVKNLSPDITYIVPDECVEEYKAAISSTANIQAGGYSAEEYDAPAADAGLFAFDAATGTVTGYTGKYAPVVTVPAQIDGVLVNAIGDGAMTDQYYMHMVELPEGVTAIGKGAFRDSNLRFAKLPSTLKTIGSDAFNGTKPRTLTLPDGLETLEEGAFRRMQLNGSLYLPESVTEIPANAFQEANMNRVYLPSAITRIASGAFDGMYRVEYIYLTGSGLPEIAPDAFCAADDTETLENLLGIYLPWNADYDTAQALRAITDPMGFERMVIYRGDARDAGMCVYADKQHGASYSKGTLVSYAGELEAVSVWPYYSRVETAALGEGVFKGNQSIKRFYPHHVGFFTTIGAEAFADSAIEYVEMFDTITTVGAGAFRNCVNLTEITLPPLLTSISADAFEGCTGIRKVNILCDTSVLPEGLFDGLTALREVSIRSGEVSAALFAKNDLTAVTLGSGVTQIAPGALGSAAVSGFELSDTVESLAANMYALTGRTDIVIPATVTSVSPEAFAGCENAVSVQVDCDASILPSGVFDGCDAIASVTIAKGSIPDGLFAGKPIASLTLGEGVTAIGANAFSGCAALTAVQLPSTVTVIGDNAFAGTGVRGAALPAGLTAFNAGIFALSDAAEITIPETAVSVSAKAFEGCENVTGVTVACDISILPENVFAPLKSLRSVRIEKGEIPARMFAGLPLEEASLGEGVTGIGEGAFADCAGLAKLNIPSGVTAIGEKAFANAALAQLVIPVRANMPVSAIEGLNTYGFCLSADASDEDITAWSAALGRPWYNPIVREGEPARFTLMPFAATAADQFLFDAETGTVEAYLGDAADVVVPREIGGVPVKKIAGNAFDRCRDYTGTEVLNNRTEWVPLRSVVLPETVTEIGYAAFSYCQQLEAFVCYGPLETAEAEVFYYCRSLDSVIFVNGLREIGSSWFNFAGALSSLYFGDQLDKVGMWAFAHTDAVSLALDAVTIANEAVRENDKLTELHFGKRCAVFENGVVNMNPSLACVCFEGEDLSGIPDSGMLFGIAPEVTIRTLPGLDEASLSKAQRAIGYADPKPAAVMITEACPRESACPDAAALLEKVRSAPAQTPAPEPEAQPTEAHASQPAEEPMKADVYTLSDYYSDYMGIWYALRMTEGGQTYDMAATSLSMTLEIKPDGAAILDMAGEADEAAWEAGDGCIVVEGAPLTLEEGALVMRQDGTEIVFSREKPEGGTADLSGYPEYLGDWFCISMMEGGEAVNPAEYGMEATLTLNADGSAILDIAGDSEKAAWNVNEGGITLLTMRGTLREDGTLLIEEEGIGMVFSREATPAAPESSFDMTPYLDYIGMWDDGSITLTITADGTATLEKNGESRAFFLGEQYGFLTADSLYLILQSDGTLSLSGGLYAVLYRDGIISTPVTVMAGMEVPGGLAKQNTLEPGNKITALFEYSVTAGDIACSYVENTAAIMQIRNRMLSGGGNAEAAWMTVRQMWRIEANMGYNGLYAALGTERQATALAAYKAFENNAAAREKVLYALYGDLTVVNEVLARTMMERAMEICSLK